ncbi:MAG: ribonuclease R [Hydrotalea sp.]
MSKQKNKKHSTSKNMQKSFVVTGVLEITRSGLGYVVVNNGNGDVLVRQGNFNTALHGDTVSVKIIKESATTKKKEGRIVDVIARRQTEFVGHLQLSTNFAFFIPDTERPMPDIFIPLDKLNGAKNKEKVIARLIKWDKGDKKPEGEIIGILSSEDENDAAMKEILAQAGFPLSFEKNVLAETAQLPTELNQKEIEKRRDYRDVLTFTIDPVDAKDFDDAISIKKIKNNLYELGIHIADVSYYVEPNTALDDEAYSRATSVYLPDRVNPMLPEKISNELCSLRPHEDKFTFSAIFEITTSGEIKKQWIGRTVIHSDHRFTYEDVQAIIESEEGIYTEQILLLNNITQKWRKQRFQKGAINFSSQEVRFVLNDKGKPIGITIKESKEAHQLIEECMLLANKSIAEFVANHKTKDGKEIPFPYRVHDKPNEDKLTPFIAFARKYGHQFNIDTPEKIAASFNEMLQAVQGLPEQHVLEQLGIRTMSKAIYTEKNIGHYGLGFVYYCHFTSPIRRYPDILVHRIVASILKDKPIVDKKMEEKCKHCSERERAAMECERAGNKYKQVEFMKDRLGEIFEGVVSGVASFGFWVETVEHKCEGLISIVDLNDYDEFKLIESEYALVGRRSGRQFRMGDKVMIKVVAANLEKRQLDYEWVPTANSDKKKSNTKNAPNRKKKRK